MMSYQSYSNLNEPKWNQDIRSPLNSYQLVNNNSGSLASSSDQNSPNNCSKSTSASMLPQTTLPPLSQVMYDSTSKSMMQQQQQQQQQQFMMSANMSLGDGFSGFTNGTAVFPGSGLSKPIVPEHDEKCPFRTDGQPRIPRPRNAFILFRQRHHQAVLDEGNVIKTNPDVSRELGKRWRALPPEEKEYWNKLAEEEKKNHSEKYPGYRYIPRRAGKKGNCPACKHKAALKNGGSSAAAAAAAAAAAVVNVNVNANASVTAAANAMNAGNPIIGNILTTPDGMTLPDTSFMTLQDPNSVSGFQPYQQSQFPPQDIIYTQVSPSMPQRVIPTNPVMNPNQFLQNQMFPQQMQPHAPVPVPVPAQQQQFNSRLPPPAGALPPLQNYYLPRSMIDNYDPNMNYNPVDMSGQNNRIGNSVPNGVSLPHINHLDLPTKVSQNSR